MQLCKLWEFSFDLEMQITKYVILSLDFFIPIGIF